MHHLASAILASTGGPSDPDPVASRDPGESAASVPVQGPRPLGALADLAELLAGETPASRRFLRGLLAGALVGAAVAGSSLLRRRRRPADDEEPEG